MVKETLKKTFPNAERRVEFGLNVLDDLTNHEVTLTTETDSDPSDRALDIIAWCVYVEELRALVNKLRLSTFSDPRALEMKAKASKIYNAARKVRGEIKETFSSGPGEADQTEPDQTGTS